MFRTIKDLKVVLIVTTLIMMGTGLTWLFFENFIEIENEFGVSHHPAQKWFLTVHGLVAAVFVFIFGMVYVLHVQKTLKDPDRRVSGWMNLIFWSLMIISGYSLLYLANDFVREYLSIFHWVLGCSSVIVLGIHSSKKIYKKVAFKKLSKKSNT